MKLAPIVLFVYNRPGHTEQTLKALCKNDLASESVLYVYADGPKQNATGEDIERITTTRNIVQKQVGFKEIIIFASTINNGLAQSIVSGVTEIVNQYGKVIVLEDDIVTSKGFLTYMNDALRIYEDENKVMHISGYMYPVNTGLQNGIVFLKVLSCWGWATWKRSWAEYSNDLEGFLLKLNSSEKIRDFDIEGNGTFYDQLHRNYYGLLKTWAVRWYASWYFKNGISIFPKTTMVSNIGHDGSGIHCSPNSKYDDRLIADQITVNQLDDFNEDKEYKHAIDQFYKDERIEHLKKQKIKKSRSTFIDLKHFLSRQANSILHYFLNKYQLYYKDKSIFYKAASSLSEKIVSSKIDKKVKIYPPYNINKCVIKEYSYISKNSTIQYTTIGKFCSIGPNLVCGHGIHPLNGLSTSPMFYSIRKQNGLSLSDENKIIEQKPISIGNDVFIGMNVTILDGITIGDGAVIGAGTVVSKNVPPYSVVVGSPMQFIKKRFSEDQIDKLMEIKWWDFPDERLKDVERDFFDIDLFISKNWNNKVVP